MRILSILFFFDDKFSIKGKKCGSYRRAQGYEKRKRKILRHKKRTRHGTSKAPKRIRQPGGSTENDDRPLFPPSGLNYYHPAKHCLLWRRIILLSLGRSSSNALRGDLRERDEDRREVWMGNRVREERLCSARDSIIYWSYEGKPQNWLEKPAIIYWKKDPKVWRKSISLVNSLMIHLG